MKKCLKFLRTRAPSACAFALSFDRRATLSPEGIPMLCFPNRRTYARSSFMSLMCSASASMTSRLALTIKKLGRRSHAENDGGMSPLVELIQDASRSSKECNFFLIAFSPLPTSIWMSQCIAYSRTLNQVTEHHTPSTS